MIISRLDCVLSENSAFDNHIFIFLPDMSQMVRKKPIQLIDKRKLDSTKHSTNKKMRSPSSLDLVEALLTLRDQSSQHPLHYMRRTDVESQTGTSPKLASTVAPFTSTIYGKDEVLVHKFDNTFIFKYSSDDKHFNSTNRPLPVGRPLPPAPELPEKYTAKI